MQRNIGKANILAKHARLFIRITLVIVIGVIVFFSVVPDPIRNDAVSFWDKIKHFAAYGTLSAVFVASFLSRDNGLRIVSCSILACIGLGSAMEVLQSFIGRSADVMDAISDAVGGACGAFIAMLVLKRFYRNSKITSD